MDRLVKKASSAPPAPDTEIFKKISYTPIGIIHSPFKELSGIPQQPEMGHGIEGIVQVFPEYAAGLEHLEKFIYITLVSHLHQSHKYELKIKRPGEGELRGVFSTRSPNRPNSIGISVVRLMGVEGANIYIRDLDILDGTPLLDIKPYKSKGH